MSEQVFLLHSYCICCAQKVLACNRCEVDQTINDFFNRYGCRDQTVCKVFLKINISQTISNLLLSSLVSLVSKRLDKEDLKM